MRESHHFTRIEGWLSIISIVVVALFFAASIRSDMAEKFILFTHTRCHMRCFEDIATAGTGLVDAEAVQPEYHAFLAQQEFIRAKSGFDLHSVLAIIC